MYNKMPLHWNIKWFQQQSTNSIQSSFLLYFGHVFCNIILNIIRTKEYHSNYSTDQTQHKNIETNSKVKQNISIEMSTKPSKSKNIKLKVPHIAKEAKDQFLNVESLPDNAICTSTNRPNGRHVLARDLKQVPKHIVLRVSTTMGEHPFDFSIRWRSRARLFGSHLQTSNLKPSKGSFFLLRVQKPWSGCLGL